ncbi:hypothetical protein KFL_002730080 [Klebsormidium nitens]|uniref:DUF7734 domain-containing protein n=1 Tax=Klebsormidium nitens TaxID=105231 RepID=A0A1Y1I5C4_KLENI|nr:hypothetical protein KFL_002730080 [Klebsormidium nitens]|eukprot:GAQ86150.1 hypothetical protein KFL_002730080 [Klebsormidium nitens]
MASSSAARCAAVSNCGVRPKHGTNQRRRVDVSIVHTKALGRGRQLREVRSRIRCAASNHGEGAESSPDEFDIKRLESYTELVPGEVLSVRAEVDGEDDEVIIFKGFSSSLMRPTATDPGEPVLPKSAKVSGIDRIKAPYKPANIVYMEQDVSWQDFQERLDKAGL